MHPVYRLISLLLFLALAPAAALAQSQTLTIGTDFWLGFMKNYQTTAGQALNLFIVSDQATSGTVSVPGQGWSQSFTVSPNVTTTITIPNAVAEVALNQTVQGRGVHIESVADIAVFAINFITHTADGSKVLTTQALGTKYVAAAYSGLAPYNSEILIVATEDNTEVEITPKCATSAGNAANVPFLVQLNQGDCYQLMAVAGQDLTGTSITGTEASGSCRPFAVFSGAGCSNIPSGCVACDHIYEQNYPLNLWGIDFFVTPFVFNLNPVYGVSVPNYTYRVLAAQNGTSISIDGGAPFTLNAGQFQEFNYQTGAHCIAASLPVTVAQYMEGISCGGNGDPAMLIIDDITKKIDYITFSTVQSSVITDHYLNVVVDAADIGTVTLDGVVIDPGLFQGFGSCSNLMWAGFPLTPGSHTLDSQGTGVSGYVYGYGDSESYAYTVGSGTFETTDMLEIDEAICTNNQVIMQIDPEFLDPVWYNYAFPGDTLAQTHTYTLNQPVTNGVYMVTANHFISGCEETFYYSVEVPQPPPLTVYPNATVNICQYESVQLNAVALPASATYYYNWTPVAGLSDPHIANPIASPSTSTTYTVTVSTPTGCGMATGQVTINVAYGEITHFEALPDSSFMCLGDEVQLGVIAEKNIWSDDFDPGISWGVWGSVNNGTANNVCGSVSGNGLYFNGNGDRSATTIPVNCTNGGNIYFSLKVATGVFPCDNAEPGDNVLLDYSLDGTNWFTIATYYESAYPNFTAITVPIPVAAQSAATRFRWKQVGIYTIGQDNWVLDNVMIGAVNNTNYTYSWTPTSGVSNPSSSDPDVSPDAATTYYVQMTDPQNGCTYEDSVFVDVGGLFSLIASPDTVLCDLQGIVLEAIPDTGEVADYSYQWTPNTGITGSTTSTPMVNPEATITYHVVATSLQGCTSEEDVTVTVTQLLGLTLSASDQDICAGQSVLLTAVVNGTPQIVTYNWSPAASVAEPNDHSTDATPSVTTTYTMTVVNEVTSCQLQKEITINVTQDFDVDATPDTSALCITEGLQITTTNTANDQLTWSWSPAGFVTSANTSNTQLSQNVSAELVVTGTNSTGCTASDTVYVSLLTETTDLGPDISVCEGEPVVLETGWPDDYTFEWNTDASTSSIEVSESGTYSVGVTSPGGCFSEDAVTVNIYPYPVVDLGGDTLLCEGGTYQLVAGDQNMIYHWSNGSTSPSITVTDGGLYAVEVSNGHCTSEDAVNVSFDPLPQKPFEQQVRFCFGLPPYVLTLDAQNTGYTYLWQDDSTGQTHEFSEQGYASVNIVSPLGCEKTFGTEIIESCPGAVWIPNSFTPDNDGINDVWQIRGVNIASYYLQIWNRWGELVFESNSIDNPWLGERRNGDHYVSTDAYSYQVTVRFLEEDGEMSETQLFTGHVSLVR